MYDARRTMQDVGVRCTMYHGRCPRTSLPLSLRASPDLVVPTHKTLPPLPRIVALSKHSSDPSLASSVAVSSVVASASGWPRPHVCGRCWPERAAHPVTAASNSSIKSSATLSAGSQVLSASAQPSHLICARERNEAKGT